MSIDTLVKDQIEAHSKGMSVLDAADKEQRNLTDAEQAEAKAAFEQAKGIASRIKLAREGAEIHDQLKAAGVAKDDGLTDDERETIGRAAETKERGDLERLTLTSPGEIFVAADFMKALAKRYPDGVPNQLNIESPAVGLKASVRALVKSSQIKALSDDIVRVGDNATDASNAGGSMLPTAVRPDWQGIMAPVFTPLTLLDMISRVPTSSNLIQFVRELETLRTLNAAIVKEAAKTVTASDDGTEIKPQSGFGFEAVQVAVKTIAHWIAVTNTALSDLPQLRALIDLFLARGLAVKLEAEVLNGSGSGTEMTGVLNTSGLATQAASDDIFVTTRKALTTIRTNGAIPTGWIMSPADVETVDLQQDGNGRYYGNGPFALGPRTLWGLPIQENFTIASGTVLGGDLRSIVYYDREDTNLSVGTVNDDFIRNIRRILAEARGVVAVTRPKSLVKVTLPS